MKIGSESQVAVGLLATSPIEVKSQSKWPADSGSPSGKKPLEIALFSQPMKIFLPISNVKGKWNKHVIKQSKTSLKTVHFNIGNFLQSQTWIFFKVLLMVGNSTYLFIKYNNNLRNLVTYLDLTSRRDSIISPPDFFSSANDIMINLASQVR